MDRYEAKAKTDTIKRDLGHVYRGLVEIYERSGHLALGYGSWAEYCRAEFDVGQSRSYQLLDAGRVIRDIEAHFTNVESPPNEAVARELAKDPEPAEAWADVIEVNGDKPTAAQARAVVQERQLKDPATDKQVAYLRRLGHMPDGPISKRTASKRIAELQSHRYCTCSVCGQHWDRETRRGL
jgi:hypothetical protein